MTDTKYICKYYIFNLKTHTLSQTIVNLEKNTIAKLITIPYHDDKYIHMWKTYVVEIVGQLLAHQILRTHNFKS